MTSGNAEELLALHDTQLRGQVPKVPPVGAVIERDGPLIRTHYGTHGSIDYRHLPATGLDELIARQRDAFAAHGERGEWKIYAHDTPADLPDKLRAADFTRGWERAVMVTSIEQAAVASPARLREAYETPDIERIALIASGAGPQRTAFTEFLADGGLLSEQPELLVLESDALINAAAWAQNVTGTDFVVIGGIADPDLKLVPHLNMWDWQRSDSPAWVRRPDARYLLAEADGALQSALEQAGFQTITTATTYHWTPPIPPAATRPVKYLFDDSEHDALWDHFTTEFNFQPSTTSAPGITEPPASATWHLGALDTSQETAVDELQTILEHGLLTCVPAGEPLYWLDWQHLSYRFDPSRVGLTGQPPWPGGVYPNGDYYLYLTHDLRLGTFGHPWERTLCVFGTELLTQVEHRLTDLLGPPIRRSGHKLGNT
jgi:hypothetical protein